MQKSLAFTFATKIATTGKMASHGRVKAQQASLAGAPLTSTAANEQRESRKLKKGFCACVNFAKFSVLARFWPLLAAISRVFFLNATPPARRILKRASRKGTARRRLFRQPSSRLTYILALSTVTMAIIGPISSKNCDIFYPSKRLIFYDLQAISGFSTNNHKKDQLLVNIFIEFGMIFHRSSGKKALIVVGQYYTKYGQCDTTYTFTALQTF